MGIINSNGILGITKKGIEELIKEVSGEISGALNPSTFMVNSELELLALNAKVGDTALRNDIHEVYRLSALPASVLVNWKSTLVEEGLEKRVSFTASAGQTLFNIGEIPLNQNLAVMYVNGVRQTYGTDFTINTSILNYLNTSIILEIGDKIDLQYFI